MIYVIASVVMSVLVSVLLKLAPARRVDIGQAVAWNYLIAGAATVLLLQPDWTRLASAAVPWLAVAVLGVLLPTIFLALAASVRHAGIVRSDAAQRLSLVLPLVAAFAWFGETLTPLKLGACALGLLALLGMLWRDAGRRGTASGRAGWLWPLLVFCGFGVIDILFKRVAAAGLPLASSLTLIFALALLVAMGLVLARRARFTARSLLAGVLLGLLNFGNIYFYLKAHRALPQNPSLVFAGMNLGVVVLGAVVGLLLFRERLSRLNLAALALALLAIGLLTRG
ncbi:MAG TPA: EamA family transporter [Rhodanobacteraceae bacterium]|nr:EamA family transporter [Rhodanobacteraceae bacterium]